MNVIVSNAKKEMLENLSIDIIKAVNGVFEVDELINMFKNFYYQRMILDITAIKNYSDIKTLQKLSISLDMEKIILVLDDSEESSSTGYIISLKMLKEFYIYIIILTVIVMLHSIIN